MSERNPATDPQAYDKVPHPDGGTMYVLGRTPRMVWISRRPPSDAAWEEARWVRLSTFQREAREAADV